MNEEFAKKICTELSLKSSDNIGYSRILFKVKNKKAIIKVEYVPDDTTLTGYDQITHTRILKIFHVSLISKLLDLDINDLFGINSYIREDLAFKCKIKDFYKSEYGNIPKKHSKLIIKIKIKDLYKTYQKIFDNVAFK